MASRFIGLDIGAETIKAVELSPEKNGELRWGRRAVVEHHKNPASTLQKVLKDWDWSSVQGAAVSGRFASQVDLPHIPVKQAQISGFRWLFPDQTATIVSMGSHGFSVLEAREGGVDVFRENSRCSQGTGNFLRQLVERFDLDIENASNLCANVEDPAPLSGRCPVILKTDMTHLANKGESRARILAGLFDAVCENVQVLIKPRLSPVQLLLVGGVSRSTRIRENFRCFASKQGMRLLETAADDYLFLEALGCAILAAEQPVKIPGLDQLFKPAVQARLEEIPSLAAFLSQVRRMPKQKLAVVNKPRNIVLGFDIGSTGSKAVGVDIKTQEVVWEGYLKTNGDPIGASQTLMRQFVDSSAGACRIRAAGATGSGREIVGSLMTTCYGSDAVFVLNEIAAHAEGARHFEPRVDTIFEIGGQDAKYIRMADGRVVDAAMNEACSAGTGSFIEEQGRKFAGVKNVEQLGQEALQATSGVSLGQHCSVFMAEIIDEAVSLGSDSRAIIAGIYDSIVQNYLNRVKGSRSVGQVIFCQGMPFAADALAAAVVRQTGSEVIIPPNPGTVGALGIALLTMKNMVNKRKTLEPQRFLEAKVEHKDTFVCKSTQGCGGAGNKCRIDRLTTIVEGEKQRFTWGGGCALYDKGSRKRKLPDRAPDPFREREELVEIILQKVAQRRDRPVVAIADEFLFKGLFPFFATYLYEMGFDIRVHRGADQNALKRGIEEANVPFCAPMQQFHGLVSEMADAQPDYLFLPMIREFTRVNDEEHSVVCPIVQASPDLLRWDLGKDRVSRFISTLVDMGPGNLESKAFEQSGERIARDFGIVGDQWRNAFRRAIEVQHQFNSECRELGQQALSFCKEKQITPVIVLGRAYTIYNKVLNSNVPAILREQGAIAIPVDCFPTSADAPVFERMFWSYGQDILRAAHQIRRTAGMYALYCSNYSCGPDSFTLHFFSHIMDGKPFAIIETDGHSGDAGTKTRVEAFLHCVSEDLQNSTKKEPLDFKQVSEIEEKLADIRQAEEILLIPRMGPGAGILAAAMRGIGIPSEALAKPDREDLRLGRRYTSGKECVPMTITLGSLLKRVLNEPNPQQRFSFFMPTAYGPCRFGAYNTLHKLILHRLSMENRIRIFSPNFKSYFEEVPDGFAALVFTCFMAADLLQEALFDTRPVERRKGIANEIYARYQEELAEVVEEAGRGDLSAGAALLQVANGRVFGVLDLLGRAAADFAAAKTNRSLPTVLLVGEIYVRCDPFANDSVVEKLEERGIKVRFSPFNEWIEYADYVNFLNGERTGIAPHLSSFARAVIQSLAYSAMAERLGWSRRTTVKDSLSASSNYIRDLYQGESVLTLGAPLHEWKEGEIDGVVSVGPLECMPNKIAESQFFHVAENEGLLSLTLSLNGDPLSPDALDNFAFEVHSRFRKNPRQPKQESVSRPPLQILSSVGSLAARKAMRLAAWAFPGAEQPIRLLKRITWRSGDSSQDVSEISCSQSPSQTAEEA